MSVRANEGVDFNLNNAIDLEKFLRRLSAGAGHVIIYTDKILSLTIKEISINDIASERERSRAARDEPKP